MDKISIVILSGGKSKRMGTDKGSLKIGGESFVGHLIRQFSTCSLANTAPAPIVPKEILLSVRDKESGSYDEDLRYVYDIYPGCGPLSGIHSALSACRSEWLFVVSCDTPFVDSLFLEELFRRGSEMDRLWTGNSKNPAAPAVSTATMLPVEAIVPVSEDGRRHGTCAFYHKSVLMKLEEQLMSGNYRVMAFLDRLNVRYVEAGEISEGEKKLQNINTPAAYMEIIHSKSELPST